jgi:tetratricopeptide (TPR) repeat protein
MPPAPRDLNADLQAARAAVGAGRLAEAVAHLAHVVPAYPTHPAVTAVVDELVAAAPDPLALVPLGGPVTLGAAAVHAYALGKLGRDAEAYQVLRQIAPPNPAGGLIDWALPWLERDTLPAALRDEAVTLFFVSAHHRFANHNPLPPDATALVRRWLPHVRRLMAGRPADDPLQSGYCVLLRQAGEVDEAIRLMRARHAAAPSYSSAVSLAAALRAARRFDGWFAACQEILALRPDDVPTRLDLGDCFWEEQGKLGEAERWYADAVRLAPEHEWAWPSLLAVRHLRTREPGWRDRLEDYAAARPDNDRARVALGRVTPFFADFLYPGDASVNNLLEVADKVEAAPPGAVRGTITLTTTGLDAPSCRRAIDRQLALWGGGIRIVREIRGTQTPDPRRPRAPVRTLLWDYDGTEPRPAVAPPPPDVAQAVGALAAARYDLGGWVGRAADLAARLGPSSVPGLVGALAHPPDPPPRVRTWDWVRRACRWRRRSCSASWGATRTGPPRVRRSSTSPTGRSTGRSRRRPSR